jgi:uncharacterized protein (DUF4415 family)
MSKKHITRIKVDLDNLPPLTAKQKTLLAALDTLPDDQIDLSDMPELDPSLYRPVKKTASVRLDADVLAWLRSFGKGYQSRMNAILRHEMLAYKAKA